MLKILSNFNTAIERVTDAGVIGSAISLFLMVLLYWLEVVSRYFFEAPTNLTTAFAPPLTLIGVMLMLPWLSRGGYHVAMTFIYDFTPPEVTKFVASALAGLSAAVCYFSAWASAIEVSRQFSSGLISMDRFMVPLWWTSIFMVYGFLLSAFFFTKQTIAAEKIQRSDEVM